VPILDLEQLVTEKVAGRLELLDGQLEKIVLAAVDRELDRLVRELVEANLENRATPVPRTEAPATKVC
jgi:hypothetical protein